MSAQRASPSMSSNKKLNPRENSKDKGVDEDKDKDKGASFIAVRWPSTLRKPLKVAAAGSDPPLTMTEYLANCFNAIQDEGGLDQRNQRKRPSGLEVADRRRNDKEQRKRYEEASKKLFKTNDRRLIDLMISLLGYATR